MKEHEPKEHEVKDHWTKEHASQKHGFKEPTCHWSHEWVLGRARVVFHWSLHFQTFSQVHETVILILLTRSDFLNQWIFSEVSTVITNAKGERGE